MNMKRLNELLKDVYCAGFMTDGRAANRAYKVARDEIMAMLLVVREEEEALDRLDRLAGKR